VTYPSRWTIKCGGLPSHGPRPDHHGVAFVVVGVMNLSVGLDSTPSLTYSQVAQVSVSEGLRKGAQGIGRGAQVFELSEVYG
jgi:hypothetical protein